MTHHVFKSVADEPHSLSDPSMIRRVFGALSKLPVVREIEEAVRANDLSARAKIGERIAALEERQERELPPLANANAEAHAEYLAAEKVYLAARAKLLRAGAAHQYLAADLAQQIERAFVELEVSADDRIDQAVAAIHEQIDQLSSIPLDQETKQEQTLSGLRVPSIVTNEPDLILRRRALLAARDLVLSWKREVDPGDVEARFAEQMATIPTGRKLREVKA